MTLPSRDYSAGDKAEMDIIGFNYQQERSFEVMQAAAANEGVRAR